MIAQLLELGTRERHDEVLRNAVDGHDVRQVDFGRSRRRELDFGLFGGLLQTLQRHGVLPQVDLMLGLERLGHVVDEHVVEVVAAEVGVAVGRLDLEDAVAQFENRNIERTAAEVVDGDFHVAVLLVETVSQSGGRRLVDDTADLETGDFARLLGSLALRIGEVSGHGDDGLADLLPEVILGRLLHLLEDDGRNLLRSVLAPVDVDAGRIVIAADDGIRRTLDVGGDLVVTLAHETLDGEDRTLGVGNRLTLGGIADLALAVVDESDHRRRCTVTLGIGNHNGLVTLHDRHAGICRAKVDTNNLCHNKCEFECLLILLIR